jgi:hypothetical protein
MCQAAGLFNTAQAVGNFQRYLAIKNGIPIFSSECSASLFVAVLQMMLVAAATLAAELVAHPAACPIVSSQCCAGRLIAILKILLVAPATFAACEVVRD